MASMKYSRLERVGCSPQSISRRLWPSPFENLNFFSDLFHRQRDTVEFLIVAPKSAIQTIIGAEYWQHKEERIKPVGCRKYPL